jgi:membrane-bound ClpP family serine protease
MRFLIIVLALLFSTTALATEIKIDPKLSVQIFGDISLETSSTIADNILKLGDANSKIWLVINSPGGSLSAMDQIIESMEMGKAKNTKNRLFCCSDSGFSCFSYIDSLRW